LDREHQCVPYPDLSSSSYTANADANGQRISYESAIGPYLYAHASATSDGSNIGAASRSYASWSDLVRLDDGGDPASLDRTPPEYLANLYIGITSYADAVITGGGSASFLVGFNGAEEDGTVTSSAHMNTIGVIRQSALQQEMAQGTSLLIELDGGTGYAQPNETRQVAVLLDGSYSFYFTLLDPAGNVLSGNPYNLRVVSNELPGLVYPLSPGPEPAFPGDFNRDGTVNSADYVAWRKGPATVYPPSDYSVWRNHFGENISNGSGPDFGTNTSIPEPRTFVMIFASVASLIFQRKQRPMTSSLLESDSI
jgi:hypothetical protein